MRIPLYIEFEGKKVAVLGGGGVGTLRAKKFLEVGADVTVFSEDFSDDLMLMAENGEVKLVKCSIAELNFDDLARKFNLIVVAVGSKEFNDKIILAASRNRAMVNLANDAERTEVVVPFEGKKDGIRFAVTTEGKSGVVARKVRDLFQKALEDREDLVRFLNAMNHLKSYMKSTGVPVELRMKLYPVVSSDERFLRLVKYGKMKEAKRLAEKIVQDYVSGRRKAGKAGEEGIQF